MTNSSIDDWESAVSRYSEALKMYNELCQKEDEEKNTNNKFEIRLMKSKWYNIMKELELDIKTHLRPTTIVSGIDEEKIAESWRHIVKRDSYPVMHYLKKAIDGYERVLTEEEQEKMIEEDNEWLLEKLIKFPFFNPDKWLKKEDDLLLLRIEGAGIPTWLLNRYEEAVYSYIYGFNNASIALCRSIVEGIIDNRVGDVCNSTKIIDKIEFFVKTVKNEEHKQIVFRTHNVRKFGKIVLHNIKNTLKEKEVKEVLQITRDFIRVAF